MEDGRSGSHLAAFTACGYVLIYDPDAAEPFLLQAEGEPPIGVVPLHFTRAQRERAVAWFICELAMDHYGRYEYLARVAELGRIAATVLAALVFMDLDGDGIPDILARLMRR